MGERRRGKGKKGKREKGILGFLALGVQKTPSWQEKSIQQFVFPLPFPPFCLQPSKKTFLPSTGNPGDLNKLTVYWLERDLGW